MKNDKILHGLLESVHKIKWGYLQVEKESFIEKSNKLVQIMKTDEEGILYFFATIKNIKDLNTKQKYFARFSFDNKNSPQKIEFTGYVCLEENQLNVNKKYTASLQNFYLFKFKILNAQDIEYDTQENKIPTYSITNLLKSLRKNF